MDLSFATSFLDIDENLQNNLLLYASMHRITARGFTAGIQAESIDTQGAICSIGKLVNIDKIVPKINRHVAIGVSAYNFLFFISTGRIFALASFDFDQMVEFWRRINSNYGQFLLQKWKFLTIFMKK